VFVKGREYENSSDPAFAAEKQVVENYGGRIIYSSGEVVFSSTTLIEQLPQGREMESHRLRLLCRRHELNTDVFERIMDRFSNLRVVVVGDVIIDRYVMCDALGVSRESPMLSLIERNERTYVGGAAIVARHLRAMGAHAFLLSTGPDGTAARAVTDVFQAEGVEWHLIPSRARFVEKTRFLAEDSKLFKVDRGDRLPLDSVAERQTALILEQQSKLADAVIFCDFGYGTITGSLLNRVLPTLRRNVRVMTADVSGGRASLLEFRHMDLLCPTEREARAALNDFDSGLSAVAWNVLNQTQAKHIFITLEKRGMVVFDRRSQKRDTPEWSARLVSEQLPAMAEHGVDLLGCGDALLAASTLSLAAGAELVQAAYLGSAAAAMEATTLGNQPIEAGRLREWLRCRKELINNVDVHAGTVKAKSVSAPSIAVNA
jgi:rfaE bifunctional protein kinase chain/domain